MAVVSRFWNSMSSARRHEMPMVSFNRICYGYVQNDWGMVFTASMTFIYSALSLIAPNATQPGTNP